MKIAIFGATGRTGRPMVEQALREGHEVTVSVRDPSKVSVRHDLLRVLKGDVLDAKAVDEAVAGQNAVLSALGHTKSSPKDVQTRGTENIVAAMKKHGVDRIVSLTG
ncbi:MAG: NAD(P)H-binding protein, partial [Actinomycetota bacterium]|nr:NAD(P)H-binding protein [Actinomycetota bacterium]